MPLSLRVTADPAEPGTLKKNTTMNQKTVATQEALAVTQSGGMLSDWIALDPQGVEQARSASRGSLHKVLSRTHRPDPVYGVGRWIVKERVTVAPFSLKPAVKLVAPASAEKLVRTLGLEVNLHAGAVSQKKQEALLMAARSLVGDRKGNESAEKWTARAQDALNARFAA